jgi:hypothetical protein
MFNTMETFIGTPEFVEVEMAAAEQEDSNIFVDLLQCKDIAPNAEVFCVCPNKSGFSAWLSCAPSFEEQGDIAVSSHTGRTKMQNKYEGKQVSYALRRDKDFHLYTTNEKNLLTSLYSKNHTKQIIKQERP